MDRIIMDHLRSPRSRTWEQFGPVGHCERLSVWRQAGVLTFTDLTQHTIIRRDPPREAARSLTIAAQNYAACDEARPSQGIPFVDRLDDGGGYPDWKNRIDIVRARPPPTIPGDSWHRSDNDRGANDRGGPASE